MLINFPKRPAPEVVRARKREIARRYANRSAKLGINRMAALRASQVNRLVKVRYSGLPLPDSDDGVAFVRVMAYSLGHLRDAPRRISQWCMRHAPWFDLDDMERLITKAVECHRKFRAGKIGWMLRVTDTERERLRLTTMWAMGRTKADYIAARKEKARNRERARSRGNRAASGATPRAEYEAQSASQLRPWVAAGVSRRTWYRRLKAERGTG